MVLYRAEPLTQDEWVLLNKYLDTYQKLDSRFWSFVQEDLRYDYFDADRDRDPD